MGGGMIRDILLNSGLPVALTDGGYWAGDDVITASGSVCLCAYLNWHRFIVDPPPPLLLVERCS
ncbi:hypothetical protein [Rothia mucilaginosa]|uniref:hypothetical protein n=1 Tax=Rothia mucilaginosa TaxID=43675 RepID=UPI0036F24751